MRTTTPSLLQQISVPQEPACTLQTHANTAQSFHDQCRQQHRWSSRASRVAESVNGLLVHRFATTLVLIGAPVLILAKLV